MGTLCTIFKNCLIGKGFSSAEKYCEYFWHFNSSCVSDISLQHGVLEMKNTINYIHNIIVINIMVWFRRDWLLHTITVYFRKMNSALETQALTVTVSLILLVTGLSLYSREGKLHD